ncbi:MAG TPA: GxxExxY protein [Caulobacteraceae bacterium]|jgi:GxxExxY protein
MTQMKLQIAAETRDPRTYAIIGAAMEVHRQLGCGFLEAIYQEALALEFEKRAIPNRREASLKIVYKDRTLTGGYRVDFLCFEAVIVELKALAHLSTAEEAQIINYLKASSVGLGLLLNFGALRLEYKRLILTEAYRRPSAKKIFMSSVDKIG